MDSVFVPGALGLLEDLDSKYLNLFIIIKEKICSYSESVMLVGFKL